MGIIKQFDSLNTSYVNLAALIRYLREQDFTGAIRVALDHYAADVFLNGHEPECVLEIDTATRQASQNEGALERLLVHAREPGGTITVYEGKPQIAFGHMTGPIANPFADDSEVTATTPPAEEVDWADLVRASGELIAAVERAARSLGWDFAANFRTARIELGDDYPFLDPTAAGLEYSNGAVTLSERPGVNAFVTGLSECLRRVVNKVATQKQEARFRERIAVELVVAARLHSNAMGKFTPHLDRIAGTRVL